MTKIKIGNYEIQNHQRINILFGKNGSGKSTSFKEMTNTLQSEKKGLVEYITPERGGILTFQSGVEQNMQNESWIQGTRIKNQFNQFKEQSIIRFKDLKSIIHTQIGEYIDDSLQDQIPKSELQSRSFKNYIVKINSLLDNVEIREDKSTFKIYVKEENTPITSETISSGESELITLAIECLAYEAKCEQGKENFLFLDEPDVHIHPDLQVRLMHFLKDLVSSKRLTVFIATHSTALIGALEKYEHIGFNFFTKGRKVIKFQKASEEYKSILPIFGAHPLSNIYCQTPIFLVEGDDDVWIWQQAIKSSGTLKLYPCSVDGNGNMPKYEKKLNEVLTSVYDSSEAKGYSLLDRDENTLPDIITPTRLAKFKKFMLSCRCAENLFLSDDVLEEAGTSWKTLTIKLNEWILNNSSHQKFKEMFDFKEKGFERKTYPTKDVTNIIASIITTAPWQVLVGKTIGVKIKKGSLCSDSNNEHSIDAYLGASLVDFLIKISGAA